MDLLKLLNEIEDILEDSSTIPLSGKALVDRHELLEIIKEIRIKLPDEIKQAEWIREERQRILAEAQKEAETVIEEARVHIEEMVEKDEITKRAQDRSDEIISKAQSNAKDIRLGAKEYADELLRTVQGELGNLQRDVGSLIETLENNREELNGM
ncbi:ATPase [Clostridium sp. D2Q-11]|uniref:ATPase n=1 Tax=Anaeromonas frigoriresistens TaxID=2683708 RepID=A0A942Z8F9_9FIRM|nr:ATPase [Anaeromonas frigoriresistens]MBS4539752.1 ATPase [Anaeromonas frigoriresistens]